MLNYSFYQEVVFFFFTMTMSLKVSDLWSHSPSLSHPTLPVGQLSNNPKNNNKKENVHMNLILSQEVIWEEKDIKPIFII